MERSFNPFINTVLGLVRLMVYANFWVAGAVFALTLVTEILLEITAPSLAALNASGTLVIYGFARFFEGPSEVDSTSKITTWRKRMPKISWMSMVLGAGIALFEMVRLFSVNLVGLYLFAASIAVLYPLPFLLKKRGGGLRSVPGLKLFLIAFTWAFTTAFIPAYLAGQSPIFPFLERFLWTAALTIPFDVRDSTIDSSAIKTLPHIVGPRNSIFIAHALLWLSFLVLVAAFGLTPLPTLLTFVFFATIIIIAHPRFGDLYYSLLIEGLPWILLGLVWLMPYL